ncbi:hypothetical protein K2173_026142 [Erythroxylum novogranatense]|uniref:Thioredoxin domain-containing protein n=1 Tax=Erythroxylum novogranatense TaxID=1862640 RepID=A0AAV8T8W3_9ROSI|nr:hypothetical protein K2173_026142 [Erythroxylum novogranatense]
MQKQNILNSKGSFGFGINPERQFHHRIPYILPSTVRNPCNLKLCFKRPDIRPITKWVCHGFLKDNDTSLPGKIKGMAGEISGELSAEDDDLCPVDCVREFKTDEEFYSILEKSKETGSLVVVDFYRTSCGSCKYIEQGFSKLCKTSGDEQASVVFLKHNVFDEYDERSETAERLRIRTVPLFHFYKDGILLEAFPTRDKERITAAISKYASSTSQDT